MNIQVLKENKVIQNLINQNADSDNPITDEVLQNNFISLLEFIMDYTECEKGPLKKCNQRIRGRQLNLTYKNSNFYLSSSHCLHFEYENRNQNIKNNYIYKDFSVDEYPKTIKDYINGLKTEGFFTDEEIKERDLLINNAGKQILRYIEVKNNIDRENIKGVYIYGNPGIGKTTIMKTLANEAAKREQKVFFCTAAELIEKYKEQFSNNGFGNVKYMDQMKKCDILFIDDFAGEMTSLWTRDNLWFGILNYRMNRKKLTFISSNFTKEELNKVYLIEKQPKDLEVKKIARLKERISTLTSFYALSGTETKRQ
ncbi:ATP-binding protein [Mesoplasma chauliocola]|uniref:ATP-binding protein n=2 Tax=Mesoplasma chauliocola TaxID=216427 RepID=A0A249SNV3_9MOLU|nr:DnaA/Hda family protein [Mesoplasma chauliocola]ASZ09345.1 ATP-binding protein [Mesoplasma chauliocola]